MVSDKRKEHVFAKQNFRIEKKKIGQAYKQANAA